MINFDKKFLFSHPQKCGGSSIELALQRELKLNDEDHMVYLHKHLGLSSVIEIIEKHGYDVKDFFKFAIIRNPWDRMVSWYYMAKNVLIYHKLNDPNSPPAEIYFYKKIESMNFQDFCVFQYDEPINRLVPTEELLCHNGEFLMDFVIQFDHIKEGFDYCMQKIGFTNMKLPHVEFNTHRPKVPYQSYYNNKTKDIIGKQFKFDIDFFGFTFE